MTPVIPLPEEVLRFLIVQQPVKAAARTRPDNVLGPEQEHRINRHKRKVGSLISGDGSADLPIL